MSDEIDKAMLRKYSGWVEAAKVAEAKIAQPDAPKRGRPRLTPESND